MQQTQLHSQSPIGGELPLTGLVILILGLVTLTPEIYMSGLMVMIVSASMQLKYFENSRIQHQFAPMNDSQPVSADAYYSW